jgi:hypothetical protein
MKVIDNQGQNKIASTGKSREHRGICRSSDSGDK